MTIEDIVKAKKCRKGPSAGITIYGAYWVAVEVKIRSYGGDGIGQSSASLTDYIVIRHYRDGTVRAFCCTIGWHQNYRIRTSLVRCDDLLACKNIEELRVAVQSVSYEDGYGTYQINEEFLPDVRVAFSGLPEADPSPDEAIEESLL